MAYTIGTAHGPFVGEGSFVIAKPAGIRTIVTGIPSYTGHDGSNPRRYFRLGRITLGNTHGFLHSANLEYAQQLLYPIPPVWELLAYDIRDGASCTFYELVEVPDLTVMQPWDRTMGVWSRTFNANTGAVVAETTGWTYTVPTGRKLWLSSAAMWVACSANQGANARTILRMYLDGSIFQELLRYAMVVGQREQEAMGTGPLIVPAGKVINATWQINTAGGNTDVGIHASGFLFDA